ncbi:Uncharacterised protein [BD1-7 clade bacterium]|uniref:Uncharacterized protein n=1 Tax=BD1-7 clade bacterium TaxID=2029982 RepID=A0A5S9N057_9GAMM|nr:Uncharacterised protein [BD1-7 clade bacterium]CAA0083085.1 Uncharacterised protein [BD1-7 clade bacterium]
MANVLFLNATVCQLAINLNNALQNQVLDTPMCLSTPVSHTRRAASSVHLMEVGVDSNAQLVGSSLSIAANPGKDIFGGNSSDNIVVVFYESSDRPCLFNIKSSVSTVSNLYLYVLGDTIAACDQSGISADITVTKLSDAEAAQLVVQMGIPSHTFTPLK